MLFNKKSISDEMDFTGTFGKGTWSPKSIPGLILQLSADEGLFQDLAGTIPVTTDGHKIALWKDISGEANNFRQGTASKMHTFKESIINSKNVVRYDGGDILLASNFSSATEGMVIATYKLTAPLGGTQHVFATSDSTVGNKWLACRANVVGFLREELLQWDAVTLDRMRGNLAVAASIVYMMVWSSNGTSYTMRRNGVLQTPAVVSGADSGDWFGDTPNRNTFSAGGMLINNSEADLLEGDIRQLLVYDSVLSASDLALIEAYLADDAGISLP